ncbi:anthranilate synthase component II [Lentibacillus sp. Marseille-P4043]|uniref:anthranilate synthase component II n=1 Tax=Lentibacillus sp. Marseille-P4043 TaxID=2040293 RepID=UPI000D0AE27E|nr:aminodeoxychorismate/anthranilate synthase component II [Lentibacillus sp. Marseille-P4043]
MILLIDNYDSFTYNLYQYFSEENEQVNVVRNDEISLKEIETLNPDAIVISPGPGLPDQAGICIEMVNTFYKKIPILGVCLGHQVIAAALGAKIKQADTIKHGKTSRITHNGLGLFSYLPQPLEVMRYHSQIVDRADFPMELEITASSMDDNEIMAIKHRGYPVYGVQFHPESIGTDTGQKIIRNFLAEMREETRYEKFS